MPSKSAPKLHIFPVAFFVATSNKSLDKTAKYIDDNDTAIAKKAIKNTTGKHLFVRFKIHLTDEKLLCLLFEDFIFLHCAHKNINIS